MTDQLAHPLPAVPDPVLDPALDPLAGGLDEAALDLSPDVTVRTEAGRVLDLPTRPVRAVVPASTTVRGTAVARMVEALATELDIPLRPTRIGTRGGSTVTVDAASPDLRVLVHACPRQGRPSGDQLHELYAAAFRLAYLAGELPVRPARLILLMCDAEAARPVKHGTSWGVQALRAAGVEVRVVGIPEEIRAGLRADLR